MSPIIGTVLVLFIVLLAMGGILLWGVPAIQGLQDHAEFQSMLTQVHELNAELLALRDAGTARPIAVSMNKGTLSVEPGSRWVVIGAVDTTFSATYLSKWEDDTGLVVHSLPNVATNVTVHEAVGGTFSLLRAKDCTGPADCDTGLAADQIEGNTIRVQLKVAALLKAEAWIFDAGRISYEMYSTSTENQIFIEMGAIFSKQQDRLFLESPPRVKEPLFTVDPVDASFLVRAFQIEGDTSVSGKGHHSVFAYLENNYGTGRGRPHISPALTIRLQIDDSGAQATAGTLEEGFCNHFVDLEYYTAATACDSGSVSVLYDPPDGAPTNNGQIIYELNQAVVKATAQAF